MFRRVLTWIGVWLCALATLIPSAFANSGSEDFARADGGIAQSAVTANDSAHADARSRASTSAGYNLAQAPSDDPVAARTAQARPVVSAQARTAETARARSHTLMIFTYGLLFALALNELLWNWLRSSRSHLLCAAAIAAIGVLHIGSQAWLLPAIAAKATAYAQTIQSVLLALAVLAYAAFARRSLETGHRHPQHDLVIRSALWVALAGVPLALVDPTELTAWLNRCAAALCLVGVLLVAAREMRKRRNARHLFAGTALALFGGAVALFGQGIEALRWIWVDQPLGVFVVATLLSIASLSRIATALAYAASAVNRLREVEQINTRLTTQFAENSRMLVAAQSQLRGPNSIGIPSREQTESSSIDATTGLANRALFLHQLEVLTAICQRDGQRYAMVVVDVRDIVANASKDLRASSNHVMVAMAQRLRLALRGSDILGRIGETQFAIALSKMRQDHSFDVVRARLFEEVVAPIDVGSGRTGTLPQVGWALYPTDGASAEELIDLARKRLQVALVADPKAPRAIPAEA